MFAAEIHYITLVFLASKLHQFIIVYTLSVQSSVEGLLTHYNHNNNCSHVWSVICIISLFNCSRCTRFRGRCIRSGWCTGCTGWAGSSLGATRTGWLTGFGTTRTGWLSGLRCGVGTVLIHTVFIKNDIAISPSDTSVFSYWAENTTLYFLSVWYSVKSALCQTLLKSCEANRGQKYN